MNLTDISPQPDFLLTGICAVAALVAFFTLAVLYADGMVADTAEGRSASILNRIGAGALALMVIGAVGFVVSLAITLGAAGKAENERFRESLQVTYGATTDADLNTAKRVAPVPVRTSRGNELVTFRQLRGELIAFRADGTELPRSR